MDFWLELKMKKIKPYFNGFCCFFLIFIGLKRQSYLKKIDVLEQQENL